MDFWSLIYNIKKSRTVCFIMARVIRITVRGFRFNSFVPKIKRKKENDQVSTHDNQD